MPRGVYTQRAAVLSLQMQRKYQVCPSKLLDGMALAFAKETLRAVQDALPVHQALLSKNALDPPGAHLRHTHDQVHPQ